MINLIHAYVALFGRLGIPPEGVHAYVRQERRVLGSLYLEARQPVASPDRLRRLAYQLALDAREPVSGDLCWVTCTHTGGGWQLGRRVPGDLPGSPVAPIVAISPWAPPALGVVCDDRPDARLLVPFVEAVLGGPPGPDDSLEAVPARRLDYLLDQNTVRLWVGDKPVEGVHPKDVQAVLRYFIANPGVTITGTDLRSALGDHEVANPSKAAKQLKDALDQAVPGCGGWFLTNPLRWADGVVLSARRWR